MTTPRRTAGASSRNEGLTGGDSLRHHGEVEDRLNWRERSTGADREGVDGARTTALDVEVISGLVASASGLREETLEQ